MASDPVSGAGGPSAASCPSWADPPSFGPELCCGLLPCAVVTGVDPRGVRILAARLDKGVEIGGDHPAYGDPPPTPRSSLPSWSGSGWSTTRCGCDAARGVQNGAAAGESDDGPRRHSGRPSV